MDATATATTTIEHPVSAAAKTRSAADPDVRRLVGMHNYASSQAIGAGTAVVIVSPELCSGARWHAVNKPWAAKRGCFRLCVPLKGYARNQLWCEIVALAWTQLLTVTGIARRWEPGRLRLRIFAVAGRLAAKMPLVGSVMCIYRYWQALSAASPLVTTGWRSRWPRSSS